MTLDEARSRLRAAAPGEFVRIRTELVRELKSEGENRLARLVASAKKPNRADWALEQVEPRLLSELESAREQARRAQEHLRGDTLRAAFARYHEAVTAVVDAAKAILLEHGMPVTTTQERAMRATLERRENDPLAALPKTRPARERKRVAAEHTKNRAKQRAKERAERAAKRRTERARAEVQRKAAALAAAQRKLHQIENG